MIGQLKLRLAFVLLANQLAYACNHEQVKVIDVAIVDTVEDTSVLPSNLSVDISFIDPTGSYTLDDKTIMKNREIYGYWGEVKVKLVDKEKIRLSLTIHNGAPNNSSGSFIDTLNYNNNTAVYVPSNNPACEIQFSFTESGVDVDQKLVDLHSDCFGKQGAFAGGFYKRMSTEF